MEPPIKNSITTSEWRLAARFSSRLSATAKAVFTLLGDCCEGRPDRIWLGAVEWQANAGEDSLDRLRRWLVFYLKYGVPGLLLVFPLALLYGSLNPWPVADRLLGRYVGQTPVMTGAVTEYSSTQDEAQKDWTRIVHRSRSYLLFPMAFRRPMAVTVDQINNDEPTLRESDDTSWPLVSFGLTYAFGFVCVWWFWIRPRLQR